LRRLAVLVALAGALALVGESLAAPVFVLTGRGYGHGIGLSQYGAQGYAQHGWSYDDILEHYYTGTVLTGGFPNSSVEVLVADGAASLVLSSDAGFSLGGEALAAGSYTLTPKPAQVHVAGPGVSVDLASPAHAVSGSRPLVLAGTTYRGTIDVRSKPSGARLAALNTLPLESYLRGVVPEEMPPSWDAEALRAQAGAARTYALATEGHCSWPDNGSTNSVYCATTSDQVYGGKSAETPATNAAVAATAGEAVTSGGQPATTFFFSTSGGKTAAKADEWGPPAFPYLVSVADPYDAISPHHFWDGKDAEVDCQGTAPDCVFTADQIETALGLAAPPRDLEVTDRNSSSRVATLRATTAGSTATFTGTQARAKLGLRSTWFHVGALSLGRSPGTVVHGQSAHLEGLARSGGTRGWGTSRLQRRRYDEGGWTTVDDTLPNGAWSKNAMPTIRTDYRVVSGNATGESKRVRVETRVTLAAPKPPYTRISGSVGPARSGVPVRLERRRSNGTWVWLGESLTSSDGKFAFAVSRPGTYRARADAGPGLLEGIDTVRLPAL
jgi:stage II sporulation protein D